MANTNIFDYLEWRGDLEFSNDPFNEVDAAILALLSYMPFEKIEFKENMHLYEAMELILNVSGLEGYVVHKEDPLLARTIKDSVRFKNIQLFNFSSCIDLETQTQFSAISYRIMEHDIYIAFRGTDGTLVGWKEDLNMGFMFPVPAQKEAVAYLKSMRFDPRDKIILGGHSKGGNLAVYAGTFCGTRLNKKIKMIYNFDGPGFDEKMITKAEYLAIAERVITLVPQSSVVGMLLGHQEKINVLHSESIGILQHFIYSWIVKGKHFEILEDVDNSSRFMDTTIRQTISGMSAVQRERVTDAIYDILIKTNASTISELGEKWFSNGILILKELNSFDDQTKSDIQKLLKIIAKSSKEGFKDTYLANVNIPELPKKKKKNK